MKITITAYENLELIRQESHHLNADSLKEIDKGEFFPGINYVEGYAIEDTDRKWVMVYHILFRNTNPPVPVNFEADGRLFYLDPVSAEKIYISGDDFNPRYLIEPQSNLDRELQNQLIFRHVEIILEDY